MPKKVQWPTVSAPLSMTKLLALFHFIKWLRKSLPSGNTFLISTTLIITYLVLFVFRYKFECAQVLRTLRFMIKALYKERDSNKSFFGELLSLETLYEMVLSHSQFLDVILSTDGRSDSKGTIFATFGTCMSHWLFP